MLKIQKSILSFVVFLVMTSLALGANTVVFAASAGETPVNQFEQILGGGKSALSDFGNRFHNLSSVEPGANTITTIIFTVIDFIKYILGALAVLYFIIAGYQLITAETKIDEVSEKIKDNIKYIFYGLILVIIADELVTKVFFGEYGECLASASNAKDCAKTGSGLVKGLYSFILAIMATVSVFVIAISGFRLVTSTGDEEVIKTQKNRIMMSAIGLIIAGVAEFVVKGIVFPEGGQKGIDVEKAQQLVYNFTNFISAFIGAAAFAMLFYGGFMYVISAGDDEKTGKAKKIIISALIGIVIALAAFGIITTISYFASNSAGEINLPDTFPGLPGK